MLLTSSSTHQCVGLLALLFDAYTTRRLTGEEQGEEMKEEEGKAYVDEVCVIVLLCCSLLSDVCC